LSGDFCPFVKGQCRSDCVFKTQTTACGNLISSCLIAVKLSAINEFQHDDLNEIIQAIEKG